MISYFIVAHCTFMKNFSRKLKSQFQVTFGQDSFALKMSPFQVSLSQNSTNSLLTNGCGISAFTTNLILQKNFPHLFLQALGLS